MIEFARALYITTRAFLVLAWAVLRCFISPPIILLQSGDGKKLGQYQLDRITVLWWCVSLLKNVSIEINKDKK
jgi:hypothetical protein